MAEAEENLVSHLNALRAMLIKCLAALGIGFVPLFFATPFCLDVLIHILLGGKDISLHYFSPLDVFILQIKTAAVLDLLVCFPYIARQVWLFVLPGLYENERRFVRSFVWISGSLFLVGVLFCLFFILPLLISFGLSFSSENIKAVFGISNIVSLSLWLAVAFGAAFQFPLAAYALIRQNIVPYEVIKDKRPYVFVGILILAALLTPPDIVSQLMLAVPVYLLFEAGLYFGRRQQQK